jgi:transposase
VRAREIQRLEKVLQDAGIKITSVASHVWSASAREIIEAMIAGERDPKVLAQMAKGKLRPKIPQLEEALAGHFGTHHAVVCRQIIDHIVFIDASIEALTEEVGNRLAPFEAQVAILTSMPGISQITAEVIVAETGADMSRFPTPEQFCSWAGVAPGSHESAGKRRPVGTRHGGDWLRRAMIEASRSASRSKASYFRALYSRVARRRGPNKAAVAVAHSMLFTIWHLLSDGSLYEDLGVDYFQRRHDPLVEATRLARRIEALGFTVNLEEAA